MNGLRKSSFSLKHLFESCGIESKELKETPEIMKQWPSLTLHSIVETSSSTITPQVNHSRSHYSSPRDETINEKASSLPMKNEARERGEEVNKTEEDENMDNPVIEENPRKTE